MVISAFGKGKHGRGKGEGKQGQQDENKDSDSNKESIECLTCGKLGHHSKVEQEGPDQ